MRVELDRLARSFAPITLAELDGRAELQTRTDLKYVVDVGVLRSLTAALASEYRVLELSGGSLRRYHTVYFDTPTLTTYRQHHQGRRKRFKCRTRLYAESRLCFFELKLRNGRGQTVKRRLALDCSQHGRLTPEARTFLETELDRAYGCVAPGALEPALVTVYRRLTLVSRDRRERVTCDVELELSAPAGQASRLRPGRVLLETKSAVGNGLADRLLQRLGARPVASCSKYCLGVALAHPDVVDNRFRPLLRRHFENSTSVLA